jgi:hypothetical protein
MLHDFISLLKHVKKKYGKWRDLYLINKSNLFDKSWYLANNPDVADLKVNPAVHYLLFGGFEGRDPGPGFDSDWYLNINTDVKKAGINPLVHYLKNGQREGRLAQPERRNVAGSLALLPVHPNTINQPLHPEIEERKIFCIGYNKTGTTSIGHALEGLGYKLGNQSVAEQLMDDWAVRDFRRIIEYCKTADAFQDLPFSVDFTYQAMDFTFPGSKFILTIRSNADEWYESLIRFYNKLMRTDGLPTADDMKNFPYGGEGWFWRQEQNIFGIDESTVCNEEIYKGHYTSHNNRVLEYFKLRPNDLLVLNLSEPDAMQFLCNFLEIEYTGQVMPHLNKSRD